MKYKLFCGRDYYPCGGFQDFKGAFQSLEEAQQFMEPFFDDWAQIVFDDKLIQTGHLDWHTKKWQWEDVIKQSDEDDR